MLDAGEPPLPHQLIELVLHADAARCERCEDPSDVAHADHAEQPPLFHHRQVPDPARRHLPGRLPQ